jgi:hypothetical protein
MGEIFEVKESEVVYGGSRGLSKELERSART